MTKTTVTVDPKTCIRCAGCAILAPTCFTVGRGVAQVVKQPETTEEAVACDAAAALCPTQAIGAGEPFEAPRGERTAAMIYPSAIEIAEGVRWKIADLPWAAFDASKATDPLKAVAREMAFSEQATFTATQKFMQAFADDPDFTQWISVWFYEETRHPMLLLRWLAHAGETPETAFVRSGRVSTPFMKSLTGTLVTNVISEVFAAEAYFSLARTKPEPLITALTRMICADEARHGASFFAYARRAIARSAQPDRERLDAVKVLHFWLNEAQAVSHPVNETMERLKSILPEGGVLPRFVPPAERICRLVGRLTGLPIAVPADVQPQLYALTKQVHAQATV